MAYIYDIKKHSNNDLITKVISRCMGKNFDKVDELNASADDGKFEIAVTINGIELDFKNLVEYWYEEHYKDIQRVRSARVSAEMSEIIRSTLKEEIKNIGGE